MFGQDPTDRETHQPMPEETTTPDASPTPTVEQEPTSTGHQPTRADLWLEFDKAIAEEEFDSYRRRKDEIRARLADDIDRLRSELSDVATWAYQAHSEQIELAMTPRVFLRLMLRGPDSLLLVLSTTLYFLSVAIFWFVVPGGVRWMALVMGALGFFGYVLTRFVAITNHRSKQRYARDYLQEVEGIYEQARARLVRESVRRQVTELFREVGIVTFPMLAPTLVELSTAKIASSRTHVEVIDFIRSHETSAIGIAG